MTITFTVRELDDMGLLLKALQLAGIFVDPSLYDEWPPKFQGVNHVKMLVSDYALGRDVPEPYRRNIQWYLDHEELTLTQEQAEALGIHITVDKAIETTP